MLLLVGCASQAPVVDSETQQSANAEPGSDMGSDTSDATASEDQFSIDHITSCDQVETVVAPYIAGLVAQEGNVVDEWGVSCSWDMAEGETNVENGRSVQVGMAPVEPGTPKPDPSMALEMDGASLVEDSWLSEHGGIGYSLQTAIAVAGASTTTIWVPGVEANITASAVGDLPAIDGPAGLQIVQSLLSQ